MAVKEVTYNQTARLATIDCCSCGVMFAMPESLKRKAKQDPGISFYCPNGHSQHYRVSEADRLREQVQHLSQDVSRWKADYEREKRSKAAYKGHLTRLINRGVCPYCRRNFTAVRRHVQAKHPDKAAELEGQG